MSLRQGGQNGRSEQGEPGQQGGQGGRGDAVIGSCGDLPAALTTLADQVNTVKARLADMVEQVRWTGPAAEAFHDHATSRFGTLTELVRELSDSAAVARSLQCLAGEGTA